MARILIVDDKEENQYYLRALLEGSGYSVDAARHGAEALILARHSPPDLVISDLLMPVMDGFTLLRHWKADDGLKRIPFIVHTATYTETEDESFARDLGADGFIRKPSEPNDFLARLDEVMARESSPAITTDLPSVKNDEIVVLKEYSQALIRKLEKKTMELEQANHSLVRELAERRAVEEEITFKNRVLKTQQETSLDGILVVDTTGKILSYNQQFINLWRIPPDLVADGLEAPALNFAAEMVEDPSDFVTKVQHLYENLEDRSRDELHLKDGRLLDRYSAPITGDDNRHYGRIWYFRDVTEQRNAENRIAYLNRVYAVLSAINTLILRVRTREELFQDACRIAVEEGGFKMALLVMLDQPMGQITSFASAGMDDDLVGATHAILTSEEKKKNALIFTVFRTKKPIVSNDSRRDPRVLFREKYEEIGIRSLVILPLTISGEVVGVITLFAEETEFFHAEEMRLLMELSADIAFAIDYLDKQDRLNYLAYYDPLTGLPNRNLFLERVEDQIRRTDRNRQHRFALFLIDLERFKNVNDSLGWPAGDALLKQVAAWLVENGQEEDLLVRVDMDRFAMILPDLRHDSDVSGKIEKILADLLEHPFTLNDAEFRIGVKGGIALFPEDGTDAETLFKHVEAALKLAKKGGDRYLFHTKKMTESVARRLSLENQLRQAIDAEEFVLYYQPKVTMTSGKVTGAEALIRWNNPHFGLMAPDQFIPILEETGLIHEVGGWALRQAIEDALGWRRRGLEAVRIAVNVSSLQLRNPGFVGEVSRKVGVDPHAAEGLELELTESMIMEDVKHSIPRLMAIREMGVSVAIDDFGTGFSSLGYLSKLPVDTLKIDRSFVVAMTGNSEGLALVSTIINLAHSLKLKVVAEGVETEEQSHLLRLLRCDEMQGFLFCRPVPIAEFEHKFLQKEGR